MKTTVEIQDDLFKAAKKAAIDEGISLRELIEDGLRHRLALHRAGERLRDREALYASDAWKALDDLELAIGSAGRRRAAP